MKRSGVGASAKRVLMAAQGHEVLKAAQGEPHAYAELMVQRTRNQGEPLVSGINAAVTDGGAI